MSNTEPKFIAAIVMVAGSKLEVQCAVLKRIWIEYFSGTNAIASNPRGIIINDMRAEGINNKLNMGIANMFPTGPIYETLWK
ncbi:hypothetical protein NBRC116602_19150 [Hyphomicrobiales bacterium 4NK60-0047b]